MTKHRSLSNLKVLLEFASFPTPSRQLNFRDTKIQLIVSVVQSNLNKI